jgi:hypothetical protein
VKVIIHSKPARKEYENLPEREPNDLVRKRLGERLREEEQASEDYATFASSNPELEERSALDDRMEEPPQHTDFLTDFLSDGEENAGEHDEVLCEEQEYEERGWKNSRWVPMLFLGALCALGAIWYLATHYAHELPLEEIRVKGANLLSEREIVTLAGIDRNERFYSIDLKAIEKNLLRHSLIEFARPHRELNPATIVLDIVERQPVAMLRSSTGEAFIIDREGVLLRPKLLAGLRYPVRLLQVPLLSGVSEKDTAGYQAMAKLVTTMQSLDSGELHSAIGELRRTPTGDYEIMTAETQTPIFIGSPFETAFRTALESQRDSAKIERPLFDRQLELLAKLWKKKLQGDLRKGGVLYVDARFSGQIIVKHWSGHAAPNPSNTSEQRAPASSASTIASRDSVRRLALATTSSVTKRPAAPGQR